MHLIMSSAIWQPFCPGGDELMPVLAIIKSRNNAILLGRACDWGPFYTRCFDLIPFLMIRSLLILAHTMAAQLSYNVQNVVVVTMLQSAGGQNEVLI